MKPVGSSRSTAIERDIERDISGCLTSQYPIYPLLYLSCLVYDEPISHSGQPNQYLITKRTIERNTTAALQQANEWALFCAHHGYVAIDFTTVKSVPRI